MEPGVLEGDRGLVGEGLGDPEVVEVEIPAGLTADPQGANDMALDHQGNREHGPVPSCLDLCSIFGRDENTELVPLAGWLGRIDVGLVELI